MDRPRLRLEQPSAPAPPALSDRAFDNLRFIRETMERAGLFTAISGAGIRLAGIVALVAVPLGGTDLTGPRWLLTWLGAAAVAAAAAVGATWRKCQAVDRPLSSGTVRRLALAFVPSLAASAVLTAVAVRAEWYSVLPGMWLMMYGAAVMAGGALSVPLVPVMGASFMALGAAALGIQLVFAHWPADVRAALLTAVMAAGFGGLHLAFGAAIARRHGG